MRGQMLLIVVLVMVVVLTVGLSAATRTITNIRVSSDEEASERAFSAAEAGLEKALGGDITQSTTGNFANNSTFKTTLVQQTGTEIFLENNLAVLKDDVADIWLSTYPDYSSPYSGNLTIHWGSTGDVCSPSEASNTMAALDIAVLSGTTANPQVTRFAVDPCTDRRIANNFSPVLMSGGTIKDKSYAYRYNITVTSGLLARIRPLYSSTSIGVNGCNSGGGTCANLPSQGTVIESVGTSANAQRKIVTFRSYPKIPTELFPYVLFAPK